ncbi:ester cyclase [Pseudonocardia broussonetiae]|uniref:Ester cyclase n=1 Tax=Pseudonocardia broussonetiae TaxID=2736640 RepID=A0A6M6JEW4_9PSEU|nr:ester cyclase [Pseudonocardia broussonetiae]QJY45507.1 ester cyclase [Pseudonocardia broussonetiae]
MTISTPAPDATPEAAAVMAGATANAELVRRIFQEVIPAGDADTVRGLFTPDWVDHDPLPGQPPGRDGAAYVVSTMHTAHSDLRFTVDDLVAVADRVVVRWTLRGIHTGPMLGRPATGRPVELAAIVIFRFAGGRIAERWASWKPGRSPQTHPALVAPDGGTSPGE